MSALRIPAAFARVFVVRRSRKRRYVHRQAGAESASFTARLVAGVLSTAGLVSGVRADDITISVPDVQFSSQVLHVTSLGATSAVSVGHGHYVVGPTLQADDWERPIVPFPRSDFASIAGLPLVSATLNFAVSVEEAEPGESFVSEVRLFSINETNLTSGNMDLFAALTGDGGSHSVVGSVLLEDGATGPQDPLTFSPGALSALYGAINGTDATIGIAFREFASAGGDLLDVFAFGIPPGVMTLEVTAVPEPAALSLVALGGLVLLRRR